MRYQCPACRDHVTADEPAAAVMILCRCGHAVAVRGRRVVLDPRRYLQCGLCRLPFPRPAGPPGHTPRCPRPECAARTRFLAPIDDLRPTLEAVFAEMDIDDPAGELNALMPLLPTCGELPGEVEVAQEPVPPDPDPPAAAAIRKLLRAGLAPDELERELRRLLDGDRPAPRPPTLIDPD